MVVDAVDQLRDEGLHVFAPEIHKTRHCLVDGARVLCDQIVDQLHDVFALEA